MGQGQSAPGSVQQLQQFQQQQGGGNRHRAAAAAAAAGVVDVLPDLAGDSGRAARLLNS